APAIVFHDQQELQDAFKDGKLNRDFIAVVRFQEIAGLFGGRLTLEDGADGRGLKARVVFAVPERAA
ncbi:hypothetical protein, partial [Agrobacterium fabrum]|uniref:hypothetical protein n=1 Tax=Agrobacterium fabrum TaxID=1176649 RepID=UPI00157413C5